MWKSHSQRGAVATQVGRRSTSLNWCHYIVKLVDEKYAETTGFYHGEYKGVRYFLATNWTMWGRKEPNPLKVIPRHIAKIKKLYCCPECQLEPDFLILGEGGWECDGCETVLDEKWYVPVRIWRWCGSNDKIQSMA